MFEEPRVTMVVLRHDQDQRVGAHHCCGESGVFDGFARVVGRQSDFADVNQLRVDFRPLPNAIDYKPRDIFTMPPLPSSAQNHWNEQWARWQHSEESSPTDEINDIVEQPAAPAVRWDHPAMIFQ